MDEEEFEKRVDQFYDQIKNLWNEFQQSGHEPWTTFMMVFDHSGKFQVEYGYEDLSKTDHYDRMVIWRYKYLGLVPKSNLGKRILEEYLKDAVDESD